MSSTVVESHLDFRAVSLQPRLTKEVAENLRNERV